MEKKSRYTEGYREDYWLMDDGATGTTSGQFILNTIRELCHRAGLDQKEAETYEKAVSEVIDNQTDLANIDTFVEGNFE